ncbi:MAG: hypothetical protein NG740_07420 [Omnitrophica bacterium]|nr:hypothetical protein [Candidatus Omnitrophota bacterium]
MKINIRHVKEKDLFELQIVEPSLRAHFLLTRKRLNDLRGLIERVIVETASKKRQDGKQ